MQRLFSPHFSSPQKKKKAFSTNGMNFPVPIEKCLQHVSFLIQWSDLNGDPKPQWAADCLIPSHTSVILSRCSRFFGDSGDSYDTFFFYEVTPTAVYSERSGRLIALFHSISVIHTIEGRRQRKKRNRREVRESQQRKQRLRWAPRWVVFYQCQLSPPSSHLS